ncbi:MAG TPA: hypothetical protein VEZ20_07965 [Allosphingosinicella sp.]|jgi:hypothetical protein|nr:hypothetical protein [Allosphingosinicella sp.]
MFALFALAAALPLGPPAYLPPERERRAYEAAAAGRLGECGIGRRQIRTAYEADLQDYSITIRGSAAGFSDAVLSCIAEAQTRAALFTRFADPEAQARYDAFAEAAAGRQALSLGRAWLGERGRLGDLPVYDAQRQTPAAFAEAIETFCGVAPGSFFRVEEDMLTVGSPERIAALQDEQFGCLVHAMLASDVSRHGISFGFIGNEAAAEESAGPER